MSKDLTPSTNFFFQVTAAAVIHMIDLLVCSMALAFFLTKIFESTGVFDIPVDDILNEVTTFTCPCILKIIDNQLALGGIPGKHRPF